MSSMNILIIERIKELLRANGLNQSKLASGINVNQSTVCNWLNGKKEPSIESLWKLADFFDVSVDYLIGRKEI
ncbi:MAG: helix-turn-helix domain-containing protein [Christensenellales bacterium]